VIVFPAPNTPDGATPRSALKMDQIRHTVLHYELDREAEKAFYGDEAAGTAAAVGEGERRWRKLQDGHFTAVTE